jgi:hypothetical protein
VVESCLFHLLRTAPVEGVYGAHQIGARSETVNHWPGYRGLDERACQQVDLAWSGQRKAVLVANRDRSLLHYVKHSDAGVPCCGQRYGYTVQTVRLLPPRTAQPGKRAGVLILLLALLAGGFAAGWFAPRTLPLEPAAAPVHRMPPETGEQAAVEADLQRQRAALAADRAALEADREQLARDKAAWAPWVDAAKKLIQDHEKLPGSGKENGR